jgi:hypothetical protein
VALSSRDRRTLGIAGIVTGTLLGIPLVLFLLFGGSEPVETAGLHPAVLSPATTPHEPTPLRAKGKRDPFSPPPALATQTPLAKSRPTGGPSPTSTPAGVPASPGPPPTMSPPPPTTPPPPPCRGEPKTLCRTAGEHVVRLIRVYRLHHGLRADIKVDRKGHHGLRDGDRIAHHFRLVGFSGANCARVVFRASGFTFCE